MGIIRVSIQREDYPSDRDIVRCLNFDIRAYKAFEQIDLPSEDANVYLKMICTRPKRIEDVRKSRKEVASVLSDIITAALIEAMESRDTEMGYPIKE